MLTLIAAVFILAYAAIALEHPLKIGKSGTALFAGGILWSLWAFAAPATDGVVTQLTEHLSGIAAILLFLLGAMSIVEYMNTHDSFSIITDSIKTKRKLPLLWIIAWVTFFLSSMLDNLTTTIVMISLTRKLVQEREDRMFFAGMIVIAANAGGAWTPIGDATTTMLWIGGQVTSLPLMKTVFLPSFLSLVVPLACISPFLKGSVQTPDHREEISGVSKTESVLMLLLGLGTLVGVPVFKALTHLPPYMGILMGLGLMWMLGELLHRSKRESERERLSLTAVLPRVDLNSIFFFAGILIASLIVNLPFAIQPIQRAFEAINPEIREAAQVSGLSKWQIFRLIELPLAWRGITSAAVLTFAHTLGEFGVVLMVGGAIPGETKTVSIALYDKVQSFDTSGAGALASLLLGISLIAIALSYGVFGKGSQRLNRGKS